MRWERGAADGTEERRVGGTEIAKHSIFSFERVGICYRRRILATARARCNIEGIRLRVEKKGGGSAGKSA